MNGIRVRFDVPRRKRISRWAAWWARLATPARRARWRAIGGAAPPVVVFAAAYFVAAQAATLLTLYVLVPGVPASSPLSVPGAVIVSALLLAPPRRWWLYLLATLPIQLWVTRPLHEPLAFVLVGFVANALLGICTAGLVRRVMAMPVRFASMREMGAFVACACGGAVPSACLGAATRHFIGGQAYWPAWYTWFLGDVVANLVFVPAIALWAATGPRVLRGVARGRVVEAALLGLALVLVGALVFGGLDQDDAGAWIHLFVPLLLWAAVRFGPWGGASSLAVLALFSIAGTVGGVGPFVGGPVSRNVLALQLFLSAIGVPLFVLGILVQQWQRARAGLARSEERYRAFFELNGVGAAEIDCDTGRFVRVNDAFCQITGYPREELLRLTFGDITHPDDRQENLQVFRAFRRQVEGVAPSLRFEKRYVRGDGATVWVQIDATLVRDGAGQPMHVVTVVQDVTERRRMEQQLRESEEHYRDLVETQSELICRYRPDSTLTFVNAAYCRHFGKPREELIGRRFVETLDEAARAHHLEYTAFLVAHPDSDAVDEHEATLPDGSTGWQQWVDHAIRDADGNVVEFQAIGRDVTARRRAEEALRASEARFRTAFESASIGMVLVSIGGHMLEVNHSLSEMLGYAREDLIGRTFAEITYPEDLNRNLELFHRALAGELASYHIEKRYVHRDGHLVWVRVTAGVVRDAAGRPHHLVSQIEDITERKLAEEALRTSEAQYRAVVETQTELVTRYLPDTTLTFVNDAHCRYLGKAREELLGTRFIEQLPLAGRESTRRAIRSLLEHPGILTTEHEVVLPDGSRRWQEWVDRAIVDADGRVVELQGIGRDVTERKRAEAALEQLTVRLLNVQDEERRRLARELHDGTAQTIAALNLALTNVRTSSRGGLRGTHAFERLLADCQALAEQAMRETRTLSYVLHPPQLDEWGLVPALEWYVKGFNQRSDIRVTLDVSPNPGRLPDEVERALYRVVQECLNNVLHHSGSACARVVLTRRGGIVRLLVADRGGGMGAAGGGREEPDGVLTLGVGIPGMRQRMRQLNGWLKIRSGDRGTVVVAVAPVPEASAAPEAAAADAVPGIGRRA